MEIERALIREGVTDIYACATHGVLSDPAIDRLRTSEITEIVLTDTVPLPPAKHLSSIKVLSVAPLIGEAIRRIHRGESVGALFSSDLELVQEMLLWDEADAAAGHGDASAKADVPETREDQRELSTAR
jgi:hypothetical protein